MVAPLRRAAAAAVSSAPGAHAKAQRTAASSAAAANFHSTSFLTSLSQLNIALVILNVEHTQGDSAPRGAAARFAHLWRQSSLRLCADGAANRLHDSMSDAQRPQMLPDIVMGDLDSLRDDVASYYTERGVPIEVVADQDSHDFEKCLRWLERRQSDDAARAPSQPFSVVAVGAFGGRLDQQMANLNMAYSFGCFENFFLVSDASLAFVLAPGRHVIDTNDEAEDGSCGLIPLGGCCERVVTSGLKWDLDGTRPLEFGSLISSSNELVESRVTVETSAPLLWTTGLRGPR